MKVVPQALREGQEVELSCWFGECGVFSEKPARRDYHPYWRKASATEILAACAATLFFQWFFNGFAQRNEVQGSPLFWLAFAALLVVPAYWLARSLVFRGRFFNSLARHLSIEAGPEGQVELQTYNWFFRPERTITFSKADVKCHVSRERIFLRGVGAYEKRVIDVVRHDQLVARIAPDLLLRAE